MNSMVKVYDVPNFKKIVDKNEILMAQEKMKCYILSGFTLDTIVNDQFMRRARNR